MNHTATEIRDGKDLLGQPVHFPVNAEKLLSAVRFSRTLSSLKQLWWKKKKLQLQSIPSQLWLTEGRFLAKCGLNAPELGAWRGADLP